MSPQTNHLIIYRFLIHFIRTSIDICAIPCLAMPAISHLSTRFNRTLDVTDAASNTLQVICAWPVSGQYGPGTRFLYVGVLILFLWTQCRIFCEQHLLISLFAVLCYYRYYVLITTCVFGRRAEWLRNACLAAALLFPAVAALHGIVLASLHIEGKPNLYIWYILHPNRRPALFSRCRYGCFWSFSALLNRHLDCPSHRQTVQNVLQ